jgi:PilZ domain-containing protein
MASLACDWQVQETTVGIGNISSFEARTQNIRAGVRVNSRVPVAVEWAESGRAMRAEGYTADASTTGCLAIIPQAFSVGQRLVLINLVNKNACEAVLIWRGHEGRTGWELGLQLQEAPLDFWGLDL